MPKRWKMVRWPRGMQWRHLLNFRDLLFLGSVGIEMSSRHFVGNVERIKKYQRTDVRLWTGWDIFRPEGQDGKLNAWLPLVKIWWKFHFKKRRSCVYEREGRLFEQMVDFQVQEPHLMLSLSPLPYVEWCSVLHNHSLFPSLWYGYACRKAIAFDMYSKCGQLLYCWGKSLIWTGTGVANCYIQAGTEEGNNLFKQVFNSALFWSCFWAVFRGIDARKCSIF